MAFYKKRMTYKKESIDVTFHTPPSGSSIISHVTFAPNTFRGHPYQMAISSGPQVFLYGGYQVSSLARALACPTRNKITTTDKNISLFGE